MFQTRLSFVLISSLNVNNIVKVILLSVDDFSSKRYFFLTNNTWVILWILNSDTKQTACILQAFFWIHWAFQTYWYSMVITHLRKILALMSYLRPNQATWLNFLKVRSIVQILQNCRWSGFRIWRIYVDKFLRNNLFWLRNGLASWLE